MRFKTLGLVGIAIAMYAIPAFAHHSFAMFDMTKAVTLKGSVKEFLWTNPHSWIVMTVPVAQGESQQWAIELGPPSTLVSQGLTSRSLPPGMKISVGMHPLRDGSRGGTAAGLSLTLEDGTVIRISSGAGNPGR